MKKIEILALLIMGSSCLHSSDPKRSQDFQGQLVLWVIKQESGQYRVIQEFDKKLNMFCFVNALEFLPRAEIDGKPASNWVSPNAEANRIYLKKLRKEMHDDQRAAADSLEPSCSKISD